MNKQGKNVSLNKIMRKACFMKKKKVEGYDQFIKMLENNKDVPIEVEKCDIKDWQDENTSKLLLPKDRKTDKVIFKYLDTTPIRTELEKTNPREAQEYTLNNNFLIEKKLISAILYMKNEEMSLAKTFLMSEILSVLIFKSAGFRKSFDKKKIKSIYSQIIDHETIDDSFIEDIKKWYNILMTV